jgi:endonuclease-3
MAAPSRTAQFARLHKILKKHYSPVAPAPSRTVLEQLLFGCCLENAQYRAAEEAFAGMIHTFYDWNEIRVSSMRELAELMAGLPDPATAAHRFKRILQSIFEATYAFDLEELRKLNLGPATERLEKIDGTTKFSVAYAVQAGLAGHWIPVDSGTLAVLQLVDLVTADDVAASAVPGLERAIPKHAGVEFGSLLHQLGADFTASPYSQALHAILLEIEPASKDRLPSRRAKRADTDIPAVHTVTAVSAEPASLNGATGKSGSGAAAEGAPAGEEKSRRSGKRMESKQEEMVGGENKAVAEDRHHEEADKKKSAKKRSDEAPAAKKLEEKEKGAAESGVVEHGTKRKEPAPPLEPAESPESDQPNQEAAAKESTVSKKKAPAKKKPEGPRIKAETLSAQAESAAEGLSKRKPR